MFTEAIAEWTNLILSPASYNEIQGWLNKNKNLISRGELLLNTVLTNREDVVSLLLELNANIHGRDRWNRSPLHHAAALSKRIGILKLLVENHAPQFADDTGNTPLHYATYDDNLAAISILLSVKEDFDLTCKNNQGLTVIQIALANQNSKALKIFLEAYTRKIDSEDIQRILNNLSLDDNSVQSAVYLYLIAQEKLEVLQNLPEKINFKYCDSYGWGAVLVAVQRGREDVLVWLVEKRGLALQVDDNCKLDPVIIAVAYRQKDMLALLVKPTHEGGYNLSLNRPGGYSPVLAAAKYGQPAMLEILVKPTEEGGYNLSLDVKGKFGWGPVLMAIVNGEQETLRKLHNPIEKGGYGLSLDIVDNDGWGPIHVAVNCGQQAMLKILLTPIEEGGYGLLMDANDYRPVLIATGNGNHAMLRLLTKPKEIGGYNLSLNIVDHSGCNPVLMAIRNGRPEMLQQLIKSKDKGGYGLSLNVVDKNGQGPVLFAICEGAQEMLQELVKPTESGGYGLLLNVENDQGYGPVILALLNKRHDILSLLLKPIDEGGYGLLPNFGQQIDHFLAIAYKASIFRKIFTLHFKQLVKENYETGLIWAKNCYEKFNTKAVVLMVGESLRLPKGSEFLYFRKKNKLIFLQGKNKKNLTIITLNSLTDDILNEFDLLMNVKELSPDVPRPLSLKEQKIIKSLRVHSTPCEPLKELLTNLSKELLSSYVKNDIENLEIPGKIVEALEEIIPGMGSMLLGEIYHEGSNFVEAYEYYLTSYNTKDSEYKHAAGYVLAESIISGCFRLTAGGELDSEATLANSNQLTLEEERKKEGQTIEIMQHRAIGAYEYLHANTSENALVLRNRLNQILAGNLLPKNLEETIWPPQVVQQYFNYYVKKNIQLLGEEVFKESLNHTFAAINVNSRAEPKRSVLHSQTQTQFFTSSSLSKIGEENTEDLIQQTNNDLAL